MLTLIKLDSLFHLIIIITNLIRIYLIKEELANILENLYHLFW